MSTRNVPEHESLNRIDVIPGKDEIRSLAESDYLRLLNPEYNAVLRKRLRGSAGAMDYLQANGISSETAEHFKLGLSTPYVNRRTGLEQSNALVYPLRRRDGKFYNKYGYFNIPGVTLNAPSGDGWAAGEPRTYYASEDEGRRLVLVCRHAKDIWGIWQGLRGSQLSGNLVLITSTHETSLPQSWKAPSFWSGWETVFLGHDGDVTGDRLAATLAGVIGREARRISAPKRGPGGWAAFWRAGGTAEEFASLLAGAPVVSIKMQSAGADVPGYGRFAYSPVNINSAYHNGHLYYPVQILNRQIDIERRVTGEDVIVDVERLETVVVRSDRTVHSAVRTAAPAGTREKDHVLRLTDGTLLEREPQPNRYGTWSWGSISAYLEGRARVRSLGQILRDVMAHLKASVWLPNKDDYAILTLTVPVTYSQRIFDSVPLIFLNGPAGTGKSETGRAMARVCANACVCGQSSAASIARFIDESRGFVVLDDLEVLGSRGGEFGELAQSLKLSYNKATAVKLWTDVKTMRPQLLDFYGVKMINNTRGTDAILGSRMLRIQSRRIPEGLKGDFARLSATADHRLSELRDELHTWAFENVAVVEAEYRAICPKGTDRSEEITAPLKVMAALADDSDLTTQLHTALARQRREPVDLRQPVEVMKEALRRLVKQGYDMISSTHLSLEMRELISRDHGMALDDEIISWACAEWAGRMLRREDLVDVESPRTKRSRVWGANLRFYPIRRRFIDQVLGSQGKAGVEPHPEPRSAQDFCQSCESCQYRLLHCEIMARRKGKK